MYTANEYEGVRSEQKEKPTTVKINNNINFLSFRFENIVEASDFQCCCFSFGDVIVVFFSMLCCCCWGCGYFFLLIPCHLLLFSNGQQTTHFKVQKPVYINRFDYISIVIYLDSHVWKMAEKFHRPRFISVCVYVRECEYVCLYKCCRFIVRFESFIIFSSHHWPMNHTPTIYNGHLVRWISNRICRCCSHLQSISHLRNIFAPVNGGRLFGARGKRDVSARSRARYVNANNKLDGGERARAKQGCGKEMSGRKM